MSAARSRQQAVLSATAVFMTLAALGTAAPITEIEIGTSPNPVGSGARAMGVGNAFIALADDATAASWNPGGLAQLELPELSLAIEGLWRAESTDSATFSGADRDREINLESLNYASLVMPFYGGRPMVASISYLKQFGFEKEVHFAVENSSDRADITLQRRFGQSGDFTALTPALAVDVNDRLSIGLALNIWDHSLTGASEYQKRDISTGTQTITSPIVMPAIDFVRTVEDRFTVEHGHSFVLGGLYRFSPQWNIGLVFKPGYTLSLDHRRHEFDYDSLTDTTSRTSSDRDGQLYMPTVIGGGVAWRPSDRWVVTSDITWTDWSRFRFAENGTERSPINGQRFADSDVHDTVTARVGAEFVSFKEDRILTLRVGLGYDPTPDDGGADDYYTFSVGGGLQVNGLNVDIAYELRFGNDVNSDGLVGLDATQDIYQHRVLLSMIRYF